MRSTRGIRIAITPSSAKVVSRTWCRASISQWPRISFASWAGVACQAVQIKRRRTDRKPGKVTIATVYPRGHLPA
ncbi:hypothetical protein ACWCQM_32240 [Streptomyces sp. NPDC002125]